MDEEGIFWEHDIRPLPSDTIPVMVNHITPSAVLPYDPALPVPDIVQYTAPQTSHNSIDYKAPSPSNQTKDTTTDAPSSSPREETETHQTTSTSTKLRDQSPDEIS